MCRGYSVVDGGMPIAIASGQKNAHYILHGGATKVQLLLDRHVQAILHSNILFSFFFFLHRNIPLLNSSSCWKMCWYSDFTFSRLTYAQLMTGDVKSVSLSRSLCVCVSSFTFQFIPRCEPLMSCYMNVHFSMIMEKKKRSTGSSNLFLPSSHESFPWYGELLIYLLCTVSHL